MRYEVVDPEARDERGPIYQSLTDAMVNAGPTLEVWELADSLEGERVLMCWPDPDFTPGEREAGEPRPERVNAGIGRANRIAAELATKYDFAGYEQTVAGIAYAYTLGERAGYMQGWTEARKAALREVREHA